MQRSSQRQCAAEGLPNRSVVVTHKGRLGTMVLPPAGTRNWDAGGALAGPCQRLPFRPDALRHGGSGLARGGAHGPRPRVRPRPRSHDKNKHAFLLCRLKAGIALGARIIKTSTYIFHRSSASASRTPLLLPRSAVFASF